MSTSPGSGSGRSRDPLARFIFLVFAVLAVVILAWIIVHIVLPLIGIVIGLAISVLIAVAIAAAIVYVILALTGNSFHSAVSKLKAWLRDQSRRS